MAQTARNRCDGNMGGYHQACVSVPQAVEVHRREIMCPQEVREPCCQSFQMEAWEDKDGVIQCDTLCILPYIDEHGKAQLRMEYHDNPDPATSNNGVVGE